MEHKFLIYIFKNSKKKKKIKSFIRESYAINFFNEEIKKNEIIKFEKKYENGHPCYFHLSIVSNNFKGDSIFFTDEYGRNIFIEPKIDNQNYIQKIERYKVEELIFDLQTKRKITLNEFLNYYIKKDFVYLISKLNNKFVLQNDDDYKIFSLKNENDCERFLDCLIENNDVKNLMVVKDISSAQKKYLYKYFEEKGFNKKFLYTSYTTYPK